MSKLWRLSQVVNSGYDTYDSMVVCADTEYQAKRISPDEYHVWHNASWHFKYSDGILRPDTFYSWAEVKDIKAVCIGEASSEVKKGEAVCVSFNAG